MVLKSDGSGRATCVISYLQAAEGPLQAVIWSVPRHSWIYAPALAVRFLFDDEYDERSKRVERPEAESIARELLGTELPTDEELRRLCEEGARMGWVFGPPRGR